MSPVHLYEVGGGGVPPASCPVCSGAVEERTFVADRPGWSGPARNSFVVGVLGQTVHRRRCVVVMRYEAESQKDLGFVGGVCANASLQQLLDWYARHGNEDAAIAADVIAQHLGAPVKL